MNSDNVSLFIKLLHKNNVRIHKDIHQIYLILTKSMWNLVNVNCLSKTNSAFSIISFDLHT